MHKPQGDKTDGLLFNLPAMACSPPAKSPPVNAPVIAATGTVVILSEKYFARPLLHEADFILVGRPAVCVGLCR